MIPLLRTLKRYYQIACFCLLALSISSQGLQAQAISFSASNLQGESSNNPTSLQFGPDGRLYVAQQNGTIYAYTIQRNGPTNYQVSATETILLVKNIQNHDDDGSVNNGQSNRQITGILLSGTAANPVLYVSSSDPRIGGGGSGNDTGLDTNSGIISRLTWNGSSWNKVDIVRGLPRSEENHATNGMDLSLNGNTLYVMQGGHTNKGAPSNNFSGTPEYALSAALLSVDLVAINNMPIQGSGNNSYIYDIPTLDDPTRGTPGNPDPGDPFGGNNGLNQARIVPGGPVQVYSPGFRNSYDVVVTSLGRIYTYDNGPNGGWGGLPINEGTPNVTNGFNENGSAKVNDQLHYISSQGYYGGHPNPTRANPQNSGLEVYVKSGGNWSSVGSYDWDTDFPDPPVPFNQANPVEGNYEMASKGLDDIGASTNGLTEYTASNFNGQMQGNLLVASFNGKVVRYVLNAAGNSVVTKQNLLNFGTPLDVTAQGDNDPFPGTVWTANHGNDNIVVYEPNDFVNCSNPPNVADQDADGDLFSNADEYDNGTDPCSQGSQPEDFDGTIDDAVNGFKLSNLNDPDDDNDGLADNVDPFAWDANNGLNTNLPIDYPFSINGPDQIPNTFFLVGWTGLMSNGVDDYLDLFDVGKINAGGAASIFNVEEVPAGDATQGTNTQEYAFQFGVNVDQNSAPFTVHTTLESPFFADQNGNPQNPVDFQSFGMYIGNGDQDNYLKLVFHDGPGSSGPGAIEVGLESNASYNGNSYLVSNILSAGVVDLYLELNPGTSKAQPKVSINGGSTITNLGPEITIPAAWLSNSDNQGLAVGIISTSNGPGPIFSANWGMIQLMEGAPVVSNPIADIQASQGDPDMQIDLHQVFDDDQGDANLTYSVESNTGNLIGASVSGNILTLTFPASSNDNATITVRATDQASLFAEDVFDVTVSDQQTALYRVNAGGSAISATDGPNPDWAIDDSNNPSPYHNNVSNTNGFTPNGFDPSVPAYVPQSVFSSERWDPPAGNEMQWDFPANTAGTYTVNLFFMDGFGGTANIGDRVFDVLIEGVIVLDNYDIIADVGDQVAVMKSFQVLVNDGNLDIDFDHVTENPVINAIEIWGPTSGSNNTLSAGPDPIHFFSTPVGSSSDPEILTLTASGGPVTVSAINITGQDGGEFSSDFNGPLMVNPGTPETVNITFNPVAPLGSKNATIEIVHNGTNPSPIQIVLTGEAISGPGAGTVLYRINAGGLQSSSGNGTNPDWGEDQVASGSGQVSGTAAFGTPSSNLIEGGENAFGSPDPITLHGSVASSAVASLFQTQRWDPNVGDEMKWEFPVTPGTEVEVRLYLSEILLNADGARIFDVSVEGQVPPILDDVDIHALVGHDVGFMIGYVTVVADGTLDLAFLRGTDDPVVNAIEIIDVSGGPPPGGGDVLLVVGNPSLNASDQAIKDRLELLGFNVMVIDDGITNSSDANGKVLVYITTSVSPNKVGNEFTNVTVPVMTSEQFLYEELNLSSGDGSTSNNKVDVSITNPGHPMSAGLNGDIVVANAALGLKMAYGQPNGNAIEVATPAGSGSQDAIFGYEAGSQMVGQTAPARRVGFFLGNNMAENLTSAGWSLFDEAICWAIGGCGAPQPQDPIAVINANPTSGMVPLLVNFDGSASHDPDGGNIQTYTWDFGDGNMGSGAIISHTYQMNGTFSAQLTVTDDEGMMDTENVSITVSPAGPVPPIAAFSATPMSGPAPLAVNFDASASTDPNGTIVSYDWDLGDGNMDNGVTVSHQFNTVGTYNVVLTVTDNEGLTDTENKTITVNSPSSGEVLFVLDDAGSPDASDQKFIDRIEDLGYTVIQVSDNSVQSSDATGKDLVVISTTVAPKKIGTKFTQVAVPVLTWEPFIYQELNLCNEDGGTTNGQTSVNILDPGHPMAAGLSGTPTVYNPSSKMAFGQPGPSAIKVASLAGNTNKITIFGYENGSQMIGQAAPARRVGFFVASMVGTNLSLEGEALFDEAVCWATATCQGPPEEVVNLEQALVGSESTSLAIYPNPTQTTATLSIESSWTGLTELAIFNTRGEISSQLRVQKSNRILLQTLDTHELASGVYNIRISHGEYVGFIRLIKTD